MSSAETAERLLEELGPILDPEAILKLAEPGLWSVVVRDDIQIDVSFEEADETFLFKAPLGGVPQDRAKGVYEMLLRFSFLVRETGGLHAALDGDGEAVLIYRHPASDLEVSRLALLLNNLADSVAAWSDAIAGAGQDDHDRSPPAIDPAAGIRV